MLQWRPASNYKQLLLADFFFLMDFLDASISIYFSEVR